MCIAIPARILSCDDISANVDISGFEREISLLTLEVKPKKGDWVLVHAGFALSIIDPDEAEKTLKLMIELAEISNGN